jgi:hypothetical protein
VITVGALCALIACLGHSRGEILAGTRIRWTPNREDNPLEFYFWLAVYCVVAVALTLWGIFILLGFAPPMPWR